MSIRKFFLMDLVFPARRNNRLFWSRLILLGVLTVLALVLVHPSSRSTLFGWLSGEPCFRGRPVSYWRLQVADWRIEHSKRPKTTKERLRDNEEDHRGRSFVWVDGYHGRWDLEHRDTLGQEWYGKWKRERICGNPHYGDPFCRLGILEGDSAAVPVLTALLKDGDVGSRRLAAAALGRIGPQAGAAFPALLETANGEEDAFLRAIARVALLYIDREAAERAGISEYFMFSSTQPKLRATATEECCSPVTFAFSANGQVLAFWDKYQRIKVHEMGSGKELALFPPHAKNIWTIAVSPDGRTLASGSENKNVTLWDVATGKELSTLQGHTDTVSSLAFSSDGKILASGSCDQTVRLWETTTGQALATLRGNSGWVGALKFSPDDEILAAEGSVGGSNAIKLWDVATGKELASLEGHDGGVYCLAFSPDGKFVASGSMDYTAKLWDVATGKELATLDHGKDDAYVDSVAFSPDGKTLASVCCFWNKIFLWDVPSGRKIGTIYTEADSVHSAIFLPDGTLVAVAGDDHTVRLWEIADVRQKTASQEHFP